MDQHNFLPGKITKCQICSSTNLVEVMKLGDQPLSNSLIKKTSDNNKIQKYPINIVRCDECTLLQIDYIVDQNQVYHPDYPYLPGITPTVDREQKELCDYLFENLKLSNEDLVVDIGSNDGVALKPFLDLGFKKILGIEPAKNLAKLANKNKIKTFNGFLEKKNLKKIKKRNT